MTTGSQRLNVVKQVFARRELEYARRLGEFQRQLDQATKQLNQLRSHRDRQAVLSRASLSTDPGRLQNHQAFQNCLTEAISQQELLIQRAKIERNELRQQWLAKRMKTKSVEKLCDMRRDSEYREASVREQKQQDERTRTSFERDTSSGFT